MTDTEPALTWTLAHPNAPDDHWVVLRNGTVLHGSDETRTWKNFGELNDSSIASATDAYSHKNWTIRTPPRTINIPTVIIDFIRSDDVKSAATALIIFINM